MFKLFNISICIHKAISHNHFMVLRVLPLAFRQQGVMFTHISSCKVQYSLHQMDEIKPWYAVLLNWNETSIFRVHSIAPTNENAPTAQAYLAVRNHGTGVQPITRRLKLNTLLKKKDSVHLSITDCTLNAQPWPLSTS
jgi:hypothetical protein